VQCASVCGYPNRHTYGDDGICARMPVCRASTCVLEKYGTFGPSWHIVLQCLSTRLSKWCSTLIDSQSCLTSAQLRHPAVQLNVLGVVVYTWRHV
jgi:hypothetical protein